MNKRYLYTLVFLITACNILAQGNFKLKGHIYNRNKKALSNVKIQVIAGTKVVKSYNSSEDGTINLIFELNKDYKVDITKDGYIPKRILVNTWTPKHNASKSYKLFNVIILDKKTSTNKSEKSGLPVSKYFYDELTGDFTGERFGNKSSVNNILNGNNNEMVSQKAILERERKLLIEAEKIIDEANQIKSLANEYADSVRSSLDGNFQPEKEGIVPKSNKIKTRALKNSTKVITEEDFENFVVDKAEFNGKKKIKDLKGRIKALSDRQNKSSWDSLNLKKNRLSLRKELLDMARYQLELDRLKAITKEDSVMIGQRESELYFIQQEMLVAEQEIENANKELLLKDLEINNKNIILTSFIIGSFLLLVFLGVGYYYYRDKKRINKLLKFQNLELEKLSVVARETSNAIIITDGKGKFTWVNNAYMRLFGYKLNEVAGKKPKSLISGNVDDSINQIVSNSLANGKAANYEFETKSKSGEKIWIQSTLTPISDDNGVVSKMVVVDSDITNIKEAEQEIKNQNEHISMQNDKIIASITYAKTIQAAILPPTDFNQDFESFLLYKPKDIVSGDFYWHAFLPANNNTDWKHIVAVVDCTGHGVPGALMSMIGSRLLNEIVREKNIHQPNQILEQMNELVIKVLRQKESENNDGMDVCLCSLEQSENGAVKVVFAGAKRPLFIYRKSNQQLEQIKGTRKSIGGNQGSRNKEVFKNNEILLEKGDFAYLSSDGFVDQPSPERVRFGSARFTKLLNEVSKYPINQQQESIESALLEYKGQVEQRDDITLLGIKV